jgi:chorismate-pyruvate lyase
MNPAPGIASSHPDEEPRELLHPLDTLCRRAGVPVPSARRVVADLVPQPYLGLLDHRESMTAQLEWHFGCRLTLQIQLAFTQDGHYWRWMLLVDETRRPLEMGAISIEIERFAPEVQADIVRGDEPLGRVLTTHRLPYRSVPRRFLSIGVAGPLATLMAMRDPHVVYGRQTELVCRGDAVGEILEVLPCYQLQTSSLAGVEPAVVSPLG